MYRRLLTVSRDVFCDEILHSSRFQIHGLCCVAAIHVVFVLISSARQYEYVRVALLQAVACSPVVIFLS